MSRLRRSLGTIPMLLMCLFLLFVSMTNIGQQRDADDDARHRSAASGAVVSVFLGGVGFIAIQLSALVWGSIGSSHDFSWCIALCGIPMVQSRVGL